MDKVRESLTCFATFLNEKALAFLMFHDKNEVCFFFWLLSFLTHETFSDINYTLDNIIFNLLFRRYNYRYWTSWYGIPAAGWNAGDNGEHYLNMKG